MAEDGLALAEGLYWMAEKLTWGYEGIERNHTEAFRLYHQAADLGFYDAYIRIGELQEHGKGTERDLKAALKSYEMGAKLGNYFAVAYLAKLLSRTSHLEKAEALWSRFFVALQANPEPGYVAASRGELLHDYIAIQLRLGLEPGHTRSLKHHRLDIVAHHQQLLEHTPDTVLERLDAVSEWIKLNLGPWPYERWG